MSLLQYPVNSQYSRQSLVNLSWFPSCVLLFVTIALCFLVGFSNSNKVVIMYATGALLESIGEPWYNIFQKSMHIGAKLQAETFAILFRCIISCYFIGYHNIGTLGFGIAQIVYGSVYLAVLVGYTFTCDINLLQDKAVDNVKEKRLNMGVFMPRRLGTFKLWGVTLPKYVDKCLLDDALARVKSSILKHLLTEADKICLTFGASAYNQGVYALTNNYGSLIVRVIFLPLEDSSRLVFAQKSVELRNSLIKTHQQTAADGKENNKTRNDADESSTSSTTVQIAEEKVRGSIAISDELRELLYKLMRLTALVALFFPVLGAPYARLAVNTVFSTKWRSDETVNTLQYYCVYIATLALNGISEGFAYAVTPASCMSKLNWNLVYSSCAFWLIGIPLVNKYGTPGLVLANTAGMLVRILLNVRFIDYLFLDPSGRNFLDEKEAAECFSTSSSSSSTTTTGSSPTTANSTAAAAAAIAPLQPRKVNYSKLKEGSKVLAQYGGGEEWSKAVIKRVREEGRYDVLYDDDGTVELRVKNEHINALNTGDVGLWSVLSPPLLAVIIVLLIVVTVNASALAYRKFIMLKDGDGDENSNDRESYVPGSTSVGGLGGLLIKQVMQHLVIGVVAAIALLSCIIYFSPSKDVHQLKDALMNKAKRSSSSNSSRNNGEKSATKKTKSE